ncbi:hypothetical protein M407DRAFT_246751 [Tulasnella calospora MUT 4182]|uniref:Uncharacterized protein n=1 Tax=Tulasnella calospora MUT 4182 TaxID=1051891 RepID=A0A0C3L7F1_9AGAM|nr:hypothetical protein M407DRAFT_246751 [Tulasnella calospora MUT 4182]
MGKDAKYHLMYGHGSTIGGCGTDSPTGFDIMTAYRAGKSNALKVLYLVPAKPISDEKIKSWSVDAVVAAIRDRLQTKKRKRSVSSDSNSEDGTEESDWASESGDGEGAATDAEEDAATDAGEDAATDADEDAPVTDSVDAGLAEQDFEPEVIQAAPPRKKRKIGSGQSAARKPKKASCTTAADAPEPTGPSSRILRERNRLPTSSNTISKAIDPLNPWHNPSSYVL